MLIFSHDPFSPTPFNLLLRTRMTRRREKGGKRRKRRKGKKRRREREQREKKSVFGWFIFVLSKNIKCSKINKHSKITIVV